MMPTDELDRLAARVEALGGGGAVHLEREGRMASLVLDHVQASNALSPAMMGQLHHAVRALEQAEELSVLLLRGAGGRAFCAGSDLRSVRQNLDDPDRAAELSRFMHAVTTRLLRLPLVSVAVLEGPAVGGGAELATCCDHRVMSADAHLRFVHATLGLAPGWGGGGRLVTLVGRRAALRLLSSAEPVGAQAALALGLVDRVAAPGAALSEALGWLAPVLANPVAAVRAAKALVCAPRGDGGARERALFLSLWGGPAMRQALSRSTSGR